MCCRKQDDLTIEGSAIRFGGDTPAAKDDDPVGHTNHFLRIVTDEDDGHSLGCQLRNDPMDFGLGRDVNPSRWLIENEDFWRRNKPFGQQYFLLVAAREGVCPLLDTGCHHTHLPREITSDLFFPRAVDESHSVGQLPKDREGLVRTNGKLQHEPLLVAVLR
jgi:hypothetical protein